MKIDLKGLWNVWLDAEKTGVHPVGESEAILLPGTTSCAGIGPENPECAIAHLTDARKFEGHAWFERAFELPAEAAGRPVMLMLERTRRTTVYVDGCEIGSCDSLCAPHRYMLDGIAPGAHTLTVRVDNTGYPTKGGHLTSPDTQSNWNGITGEISLTCAQNILYGVQVVVLPGTRTLHISADVLGARSGVVRISVDGLLDESRAFDDGRLDVCVELPVETPLWSEFAPNLLTLRLDAMDGAYETVIGLRDFRAVGRELRNNGQRVFLRGKHDGLIFPDTGFAPTDVESWLRVMRTAQEYGVNHYRFHTCCPPDAAFCAADQLGIYMEPELPFWGTITDEGDEGHNPVERAFLTGEGFRILREFGHHPSFVMMSMGNELWGSKDALNRMLHDYRAFAPDKLYTSGSNNFQFVPDVLDEEDFFVGVRFSRDRLFRGSYAMCDAPQGIVQVTEPESVTNYDKMIVPDSVGGNSAQGSLLIQYETGVKEVTAEAVTEVVPEVPVISHEIGQYEFYPDFNEIGRYTGPLKPRNLETFRERLEQAGLYQDHERFFRSAGKLAIDCYRRELEAVLRTRELAGCQILDIQDFSGQGTALVGVLNAFMESKGLIPAEQWRSFFSSCVVLGELEKFVFASGEELSFGVKVSECNPDAWHSAVCCTLYDGCTELRRMELEVPASAERVTDCGMVSMGLLEVSGPKKLELRLVLDNGCHAEYPIWVYPQVEVAISPSGIRTAKGEVRFVADVEEARKLDGRAIVVPSASGKLTAEYCTDFWCYPMFRSISEGMGKPVPVGTLGLCINAQHALLKGFMAEDYTTPQWYHVLAHAHCEPIGADAQPVVQMIDNVERCQRLGILYVQDGVLHLTSRLWEAAGHPAVRAFACALCDGLIG